MNAARRPLRIFVYGAGRAGGALALALAGAGHQVATSHRTAAGRARARAARLPRARFDLSEADLVLLGVPDAAIAASVLELAPRARRGQVFAHLSGALGLEGLAPLRARGAHPGSLHPLCAIPAPRTDLGGIAAAIDGDARARGVLAALARQIGMTPLRIRPAERPLYHAAAVLASNGLVGLAAESARLLRLCGLSAAQASSALLPLMRSALDGVASSGLRRGLTGPVARGDAEVVASHLRALRKRDADALRLYQALGAPLLRLAVGPNTAGRRRVARLLAARSRRPSR